VRPEREQKMKNHQKKMTGRDFDALPDAEKERIYKELDEKTPEQLLKESRPLTKAEKIRELRCWKLAKARLRRSVIGNGSTQVSITMERDLLKRADAYAKQHGMKRAQLVAESLRKLLAAS
jgi:hypothetical protein